MLRIVASLAGGTEINLHLNEAIPGLGRQELDLVLSAIAHAAGSHDDRVMGTRQGRRSDSGELFTAILAHHRDRGETVSGYAFHTTAKRLYQDRLGLVCSPIGWCAGSYYRLNSAPTGRSHLDD